MPKLNWWSRSHKSTESSKMQAQKDTGHIMTQHVPVLMPQQYWLLSLLTMLNSELWITHTPEQAAASVGQATVPQHRHAMPCSSKWDIGDLSCTFAMGSCRCPPCWLNGHWPSSMRCQRWSRPNHCEPPMATGVGSLIWAVDGTIGWSIRVPPQNTIHVLDPAPFCLTNSNSKCISSWHDELMCIVLHPLLSKKADVLREGKKKVAFTALHHAVHNTNNTWL
jgi:hypothetical protein